MALSHEFVPIAQLQKELEEVAGGELDYVTCSGAAEPTLAANPGIPSPP
jgi:wyosine [tRNA(Phe)-imidazoG37] synthetase (radical SAM superfamily)